MSTASKKERNQKEASRAVLTSLQDDTMINISDLCNRLKQGNAKFQKKLMEQRLRRKNAQRNKWKSMLLKLKAKEIHYQKSQDDERKRQKIEAQKVAEENDRQSEFEEEEENCEIKNSRISHQRSKGSKHSINRSSKHSISPSSRHSHKKSIRHIFDEEEEESDGLLIEEEEEIENSFSSKSEKTKPDEENLNSNLVDDFHEEGELEEEEEIIDESYSSFESDGKSSKSSSSVSVKNLKRVRKGFVNDPIMANKILFAFEKVRNPEHLIKKSNLSFVNDKIDNAFNGFMVKVLFGDIIEKVSSIQNKLANETLVKCVSERTVGRFNQIQPLLEGAANQRPKRPIRDQDLGDYSTSEE
ncbi:hypothetical protein TRFO_29393 [Tritrichomonas foetus]|uniref:Uncharacterized protein n=1 Tax=Tritrichomonas foetus TaxID=1144522 RepID=A0A1J4JX62_9EUKA|nr:hypothetical protein TRFO_29393 [Tritrichomonas foetus]|eukprot:OHT03258.1 hypothetical protein TRFO_29393 [Tritrichomonas foetus]